MFILIKINLIFMNLLTVDNFCHKTFIAIVQHICSQKFYLIKLKGGKYIKNNNLYSEYV